MSLKIPNIGDKVYCIKDVYDLYHDIIIKEGSVNTIHFIYKKHGVKSLIAIVCDKLVYTFDINKSTGLNYCDYFCDKKEHRKRKLETIIKECQ